MAPLVALAPIQPATELVYCPCGELLAERQGYAVVASRGGLAFLDPAAIRCERCGTVWSNPYPRLRLLSGGAHG